ncbi:MAG TPA: hypothetical protein VHZ76_08170 [Gammaproteobacteria bacterium]|jgi:hypothetical protein|nr:hypothetical protein [Gammaproteobacteria bacterium]
MALRNFFSNLSFFQADNQQTATEMGSPVLENKNSVTPKATTSAEKLRVEYPDFYQNLPAEKELEQDEIYWEEQYQQVLFADF